MGIKAAWDDLIGPSFSSSTSRADFLVIDEYGTFSFSFCGILVIDEYGTFSFCGILVIDEYGTFSFSSSFSSSSSTSSADFFGGCPVLSGKAFFKFANASVVLTFTN